MINKLKYINELIFTVADYNKILVTVIQLYRAAFFEINYKWRFFTSCKGEKKRCFLFHNIETDCYAVELKKTYSMWLCRRSFAWVKGGYTFSFKIELLLRDELKTKEVDEVMLVFRVEHNKDYPVMSNNHLRSKV